MELYDKAHALAEAIGNAKEYQALLDAGKKLEKDPKATKLVKEYLMLQAQLAYAQSMGNKPVKKKIEQLNLMAERIKKSEEAMEYLHTYNMWQAMAGEVFQIIQNAMAEGMSILDQN